MRKVTLYSRSARSGTPSSATPDEETPGAAPEASRDAGTGGPVRQPQHAAAQPAQAAAPGAVARTRWWKRKSLWASSLVVIALVATFVVGQRYGKPGGPQLTQEDIDAAVLHTLNTKQLPSAAARSYAAIRPSVVRVLGLGRDADDKEDVEKSVGSGVVIVDSGMILTNLHVVAGAEKLKVIFWDGLESEANVVSTQPENDLAVLQARKLPDDLKAATLRSTSDLSPGDEVIAVGFPFGIGPSVSSGVVSGLRREYRSADGTRQLTNLIQFDAAANPGSSGGPLVTTDGAVVGIVTGILNRGDQRVFIGIGFAVPIENAAAGVGLSPF